MTYMVISKVAGRDYITRVEARSAYLAEHMILDKGIRGRHDYGVDDAQAFDAKAMKTDFFINATLHAISIDKKDLFEIIERNNESIREKDAAEENIEKKETMEIIERQRLNVSDVREVCVKENLYTLGTNDEYDSMFDMVMKLDHKNIITAADLYPIAADILIHSKTDMDVTGIMYYIAEKIIRVYEYID